MADRSIDKREQYVALATHCLQMAKVAGDDQSHAVLKEMAADWLKLVDAALPMRVMDRRRFIPNLRTRGAAM